ncbi:hypothetical protein CPAR01_14101 [Colletotrichum paranaense]|uniref:Uncharacterized protein n=1 Tax=Colletotrichum paranaense TaxID=1914294 RepID=A0ABQ9S377_9PEZI|nr:uncharacterized protein CPAR01_14101 [Colletotrichum paranaense]KAK1523248.1 hypothetical protein CPAR01_14101 [Colletotrichum paranaense]
MYRALPIPPCFQRSFLSFHGSPEHFIAESTSQLSAPWPMFVETTSDITEHRGTGSLP